MLFEFIALANSSLELFLRTWKRDLTSAGVHPLVTSGLVNVIGHPFILIVLASLSQINIPQSFYFYLFFSSLVISAHFSSYFKYHGFTKSLFSSAMFVMSTKVIFVAIGAVIFLKEEITPIKWLLIFTCFIGLIVLTLPKKISRKALLKNTSSYGLFLVFLGVLFGSASSLFYRAASLQTPNFSTFLTGRLLTDLVLHGTTILIISLFLARNAVPLFFAQKNSNKFLILTIGRTLITSFMVFVLPASTLTLLSTVVVPLSFLFGKIKYKEHATTRIYFGSAIVFVSVILFILL